ncbi:MAG: pirin family protein [Deltaproteobacteria bacterium]|nr:pirin family protein [Deltaproteobacteria bacterium]
MKKTRKIRKVFKPIKVTEGAGVHLSRAFGRLTDPTLFDPFLMLDDFRSEKKEEYIKGFPWHPHRGIETITYILRGKVEHRDSLGSVGIISDGCVQWMTAGSGIIHQEMPLGDEREFMWGFQLWTNLRAEDKMIAPRYRDIRPEDIPNIDRKSGAKIKIISGEVFGKKGAVQDVLTNPVYLDVTLPPNSAEKIPTKKGDTAVAYIIGGSVDFNPEGNETSEPTLLGNKNLILFEVDGEAVSIKTGSEEVRFLFLSGTPIKEDIAWRGPIVMNTEEELDLAFKEYADGTFVKNKK